MLLLWENMDIITRESNNEHLLEKINEYFCEDNKSFMTISYDQLLWYLETVFVWYELAKDMVFDKKDA